MCEPIHKRRLTRREDLSLSLYPSLVSFVGISFFLSISLCLYPSLSLSLSLSLSPSLCFSLLSPSLFPPSISQSLCFCSLQERDREHIGRIGSNTKQAESLFFNRALQGVSGDIKCWGRNSYGDLGVGDSENRGDKPEHMGNNLAVVNLGNHALARQVVAHNGATASDLSV